MGFITNKLSADLVNHLLPSFENTLLKRVIKASIQVVEKLKEWAEVKASIWSGGYNNVSDEEVAKIGG